MNYGTLSCRQCVLRKLDMLRSFVDTLRETKSIFLEMESPTLLDLFLNNSLIQSFFLRKKQRTIKSVRQWFTLTGYIAKKWENMSDNISHALEAIAAFNAEKEKISNKQGQQNCHFLIINKVKDHSKIANVNIFLLLLLLRRLQSQTHLERPI